MFFLVFQNHDKWEKLFKVRFLHYKTATFCLCVSVTLPKHFKWKHFSLRKISSWHGNILEIIQLLCWPLVSAVNHFCSETTHSYVQNTIHCKHGSYCSLCYHLCATICMKSALSIKFDLIRLLSMCRTTIYFGHGAQMFHSVFLCLFGDGPSRFHTVLFSENSQNFGGSFQKVAYSEALSTVVI